MTNREQVTDIELQNVPLPQRRRTRGLPSQISAALLQPVYFFRTLPLMSETRQWLWVGLLILFLIGFSAVRYEAVSASASGEDPFGQPPIDFGSGGFEGGGVIDSGGIPGGGIDFGGIPDPSPGGETPTGGTSDPAQTLTTGIIAASEIVVSWFVITLLLVIVSLLRGRMPRPGHNFQIAIWATLPLALMALLQVLFLAAGGTPGAAGLSGLLPEWKFYQQQSPLMQDVLYSLSLRLTLFWLWALVLLYFGARHALHGPRFGALFVAVFWAVQIVVVPVASGAIAAPSPDDPGLSEGEFPSGEFPSGEFPSGEFPGGEFPEGEVPDIIVPDFGDESVTEEASETGDETGEEVDMDADSGRSGGEEIPPTEIDALESNASGNTGNTGNTSNTRPSVPPERSAEVEPTP